MATKPLRIGIVGTGGIARSVHIPGYQRLGNRVELVSTFDVAGDRAEKTAKEFGIPNHFTDFDAMLKGPKLDAISICTPPNSHAPLAVKAFEHGLHVLSEKPVSTTAVGAIEMVRAARKAKRVLMIGFQHRFSREEKALKRVIQDGMLGDIYYSRALAIRRRGIPGWGVFASKELSGGGPMMDIGVHVLDQTMYLLGNPTPVSVFGSTYRKLGTRAGYNSFGSWDHTKFETEDFATALVKFSDGATMLIEASWAINLGANEHNVVLAGTKGGAELTPFKVFTEQSGMLLDATVPEETFRGRDTSQDEKIAHFVDCIENGTTPLVTPSEIVNVAMIIDAVYKSAETGKAVDIVQPTI